MTVWLLLLCAATVGSAQTPGGAPVEVIVRLAPSAPAALRQALSERRFDASLQREVRASRAVFARELPGTYVVTAVDSAAAGRLVAHFAGRSGVLYAVPNHVRRLDGLRMESAAAPFDSLANYRFTGVDAAHAITTGVASVRVGIVDTGLDLDHPAFAGQLAINAGEDLDGDGRVTAADFNGVDDDGNGFVDDIAGYDFVDRPTSVGAGDVRQRDPNPDEDDVPAGGRGHGTTVAGIVAGRRDGAFVGVAPGVRLVPLRAFSADGTAEDDDIAAAILYAAGGPNRAPLDVLNLSFGDVYESPLLRDAIAFAVDRGVVVVASAGNDGSDGPHYPSDYPGVIGVQWLSEDGTAPGFLASYGTGVDVGAPSTLVYSPRLFDAAESAPRSYGRASGSSVAAPLVAGAAALLRSVDPTLSPDAIRSILTATADDIGDSGWDHRTGAGRVRVDRALVRALPGRVEVLSPASNDGVRGRVALVGSALDPAFVSYRVDVAPGDSGDFVWTALSPERTTPVSRDTLALWDTDGLAEGLYTLRLVVTRADGRTTEARQRAWVDRSAPAFRVARAQSGFSRGAPALLVDVETDDLTTVTGEASGRAAASDRRARVHGLTLPLPPGAHELRVTARNTSGLTTTITLNARAPSASPGAGLFRETVTAIPEGSLLPRATDFDGDGLPELVVNRADVGGLASDSVLVLEWTGRDFTRVHSILAPFRPRDAGDTNGDGRGELLLTYGGASFLLEATAVGGFPDRIAFADTTALRNETSTRAFYASRITDLDGDGVGELAGHNTRDWRVLERAGGTFVGVDTLRNPTAVSGDLSRNEANDAMTAYADVDGNGRAELVTLDADGDLVAFELDGGGATVRWTATTARYGFRPRFATGRFENGRLGLVVAMTSWPSTLSSREQEPPRTILYRLDARDGRVALRDSIGFDADAQRNVALAALDVDGDGTDELVVALAPDLYVFSVDTEGRWVLRDVRREAVAATPSGTRGPDLVVVDIDRDGVDDLFVPMADGQTRRLTPARSAPTPAPSNVRLTVSAAGGPVGRMVVRWVLSSGADSIAVYGAEAARTGRGLAGFDVLGTTRADSFVVEAPRDRPLLPAQVFVVAWTNGRASMASDPVERPQGSPPQRSGSPVAVAVTTPDDPRAGYVSLVFDRALALPTPGQLRLDERPADVLDAGQRHPSTADPRELLIRDDGVSTRVSWSHLRAADGTPVPDGDAEIVRSRPSQHLFVLVSATVEGPQRVRLRFSAPLDSTALSLARYEVRPGGEVVRAEPVAGRPEEIVLTISGAAVGPTGRPTGIVARGLRSADGRLLDPDGGAVDLARAAADLRGLTAYPNPVRTSDAAGGVTIAGLPAEASLTVLSPDGRTIRVFEETDGDGGLHWDLRDRDGADVPSGVYLVRVVGGGDSRFVRIAVLR